MRTDKERLEFSSIYDFRNFVVHRAPPQQPRADFIGRGHRPGPNIPDRRQFDGVRFEPGRPGRFLANNIFNTLARLAVRGPRRAPARSTLRTLARHHLLRQRPEHYEYLLKLDGGCDPASDQAPPALPSPLRGGQGNRQGPVRCQLRPRCSEIHFAPPVAGPITSSENSPRTWSSPFSFSQMRRFFAGDPRQCGRT